MCKAICASATRRSAMHLPLLCNTGLWKQELLTRTVRRCPRHGAEDFGLVTSLGNPLAQCQVKSTNLSAGTVHSKACNRQTHGGKAQNWRCTCHKLQIACARPPSKRKGKQRHCKYPLHQVRLRLLHRLHLHLPANPSFTRPQNEQKGPRQKDPGSLRVGTTQSLHTA